MHWTGPPLRVKTRRKPSWILGRMSRLCPNFPTIWPILMRSGPPAGLTVLLTTYRPGSGTMLRGTTCILTLMLGLETWRIWGWTSLGIPIRPGFYARGRPPLSALERMAAGRGTERAVARWPERAVARELGPGAPRRMVEDLYLFFLCLPSLGFL